MPFIFVTSVFPSHKGPEVGKKFLEQLQKYPDDESLGTTVVNAAVRAGTEGIQAVTITEVKKGKLEEAITRTNTVIAMYNEIEGFEYKVELWETAAEALTTIGMKMP